MKSHGQRPVPEVGGWGGGWGLRPALLDPAAAIRGVLKERKILLCGLRGAGEVCAGEPYSRVFSAYRFIFSLGEAGCAKWVVSTREGQEVSLSAGNSKHTSFSMQMLAVTFVWRGGGKKKKKKPPLGSS